MSIETLVFEIEIAKQRLHHALTTQNEPLAVATQKQLANLNQWLFEAVKQERSIVERSAVYYLVFSEEYQDGIVLSQVEYRNLCKRMTPFDFKNHSRTEVPGPMRDATEQAIFEVVEVERSQKKPA